MSKITDRVTALAMPIVQEEGCSLWDVEYVREGADYFLRVYIDKEGGVDIADCEAISRALDPILDEKDPIPGSYHFEVCSAGLERSLKRPSDFERFSWKGLSLNTQWTGAWNVSRMISGVFRYPFYNKTSHTQGGLLKYVIDNSWTPDNPSQSAKYPRPSWDNWDNNYAESTLYEQDAKRISVIFFFITEEISTMTTNAGSTTPKVAIKAPKNPPFVIHY